MRPTSLTARQIIFDHDMRWALDVAAGGGLFCESSGIQATSTTLLAVGAWTHVACVLDVTALTIYVNGRAEGSVVVPALAASKQPAAIAGNAPPTDIPRLAGRVAIRTRSS